jgi:uncharacterized protein YlxW (UPF0749 family)
VVTLADSKQKPPPGLELDYIVHDMDVRAVMNELWLAGAEAMSVNGQRVVLNTGVRCGGSTNLINGVPAAAPFVIKAIGPTDAMSSALSMHGGVMDDMAPYIQISVKRDDKLVVEAFSGSTQLKYATPVETTKTDEKGKQ